MVLVDTSSWIETLRASGDREVRGRIGKLVVDGDAAWCDMVRLELWNGVRGDRERKDLVELETVVSLLEIDAAVWDRAMRLTQRARSNGLNLPAADLLIAATAHRHGVRMHSMDRHMERLMNLK